jgi:hypothetical protein
MELCLLKQPYLVYPFNTLLQKEEALESTLEFDTYTNRFHFLYGVITFQFLLEISTLV